MTSRGPSGFSVGSPSHAPIDYSGAVLENLPGEPLVFDKFQAIELVNEKLTKVRRQRYHELKGGLGKQVLKGARWILLKNPENLSQRHSEHERLEASPPGWQTPNHLAMAAGTSPVRLVRGGLSSGIILGRIDTSRATRRGWFRLPGSAGV